MKSNKILIVSLSLFVFAFTFTGCEKVLDKTPKNSFAEKEVWGDQRLAKMFENSIYNGLGNWGIGYDWNGHRTLADVATTDIYNPWDGFNSDVINLGFISPDNVGLWGIGWSYDYMYIRKCNVFLSEIDNVPGDEDEKNILKGETKYLRAYFYFDLTRYWGGVPLITKVFNLDDDFMVPRDPYEKIVDWIVNELDEARAMVPQQRSPEEFGRIDKGTCLALKSRVLLYANSKLHHPDTKPSGPLYSYTKNTWQDVADAAKAVIDMPQYSLQVVGNWEDYTKIFLVPNSEMISVQCNDPAYIEQDGGVGNSFEHVNGSAGVDFMGWSNNYPTQNIVDEFEMKNGKRIDEAGSGYNPLADSIYANRELRFYADILYNGVFFEKREMEYFLPGGKDSKDDNQPWNSPDTQYNIRKCMNPAVDISSGKGDQPWIYIRLVEMYLNYAEAQYEMGNEAEARKYVNIIRNRVHLADINTSGEDLFKDIQHERRIELFIEHHRFFDVRRWMIADVTGNEAKRGISWKKVDASGNLDPAGKLTYQFTIVQNRKFVNRMYYLPIPIDEIHKSNLIQNEGYE